MFTPVETSLGAFLLHLSTSTLFFNNGSILGQSGLLRRLLTKPDLGTLLIFSGMAASFVPLQIWAPEILPVYPSITLDKSRVLGLVGIGILTGWGTKNGKGCTSGHMLCGLARFSKRSLIATAVFFPTALLTFHATHVSTRTSVCTDIPCYKATIPEPGTLRALAIITTAATLSSVILPKLMAKVSNNISAVYLTNLISGFTFGLGLLISGMASSDKVLAFFAFPDLNNWDPSLALVIAFGVLPNAIANYLYYGPEPPRFAPKYDVPANTSGVDWRFVVGSAVFGLAWGSSGVCPGPAALRIIAQPLWGAQWLAGFWLGSVVNV